MATDVLGGGGVGEMPPLALPPPALDSKEHQIRLALTRDSAWEQGYDAPSRNITQILSVVTWLEKDLTGVDLLAKTSRLDVKKATPQAVIYSFLADYDLTFNNLFHTALDAATHTKSKHFSVTALKQWCENAGMFRQWLLAACKSAAILFCYGQDRQLAPHEHAAVHELREIFGRDQAAEFIKFGTAVGTYIEENQSAIAAMSVFWDKTEIFAGQVVQKLLDMWDAVEERRVQKAEENHEADNKEAEKEGEIYWFEDSEGSCEACETGGVCSQYKHSCLEGRDQLRVR
jgi:predicted metal-binding protein